MSDSSWWAGVRSAAWDRDPRGRALGLEAQCPGSCVAPEWRAASQRKSPAQGGSPGFWPGAGSTPAGDEKHGLNLQRCKAPRGQGRAGGPPHFNPNSLWGVSSGVLYARHGPGEGLRFLSPFSWEMRSSPLALRSADLLCTGCSVVLLLWLGELPWSGVRPGSIAACLTRVCLCLVCTQRSVERPCWCFPASGCA